MIWNMSLPDGGKQAAALGPTFEPGFVGAVERT